MIVKNIISEEPLTLAEVRKVLEEVREKRGLEEGLGYELRRAIRHAELFGQGTDEESRKLVLDLLELEKMNPEVALKIVDIRPKTRDELRAVYAKERFTLAEEELDKILDILQRE